MLNKQKKWQKQTNHAICELCHIPRVHNTEQSNEIIYTGLSSGLKKENSNGYLGSISSQADSFQNWNIYIQNLPNLFVENVNWEPAVPPLSVYAVICTIYKVLLNKDDSRYSVFEGSTATTRN